MGIKLDNGIYYVDVSKQGWRKRKILPANSTLDDAKLVEVALIQEYKKWLSAQQNGGIAEGVNTLEDALKIWVQEASIKGAQSRYDGLVRDLGNIPLHELYGKLMEYRKLLQSKDLAPATINRYVAMAKAAVHTCYEKRVGVDWHRLIPENYLSGFPMMAENNIKYLVLNPKERKALYDELPEYLKPLFYQASYYPCRKEELLGMIKDDVDLFRKKIWIPEDRSKNGRGRNIPIPPEMIQWFIWIKEERSGDEHVHCRLSHGRWVPIVSFKSAWESACSRAAEVVDSSRILEYNWHKTRQQAAMELMYEGWDSMEVMHVGGWKTLTAFKRYVNIDDIKLDIRQGLYKPDFEWRKNQAPQPIRKVA